MAVPGQLRPLNFVRPLTSIEPEIDLTRANAYLVQLKGPLTAENGQQIESSGARLLEAYGRQLLQCIPGRRTSAEARRDGHCRLD